MKKIMVGILLCTTLLITGCSKIPKLSNGEEVVAKIDGKEISANELYKEIKKQYGTSMLINLIDNFIANKEIETDDDAKEYADSRIEQLKLQYKAANEDFNADLIKAGYNSEDEFKEVLILDYKKNKVMENHVKNKLTDNEIKKFYDNEIYGEMTVRHILIAPEVTSTMTTEEQAVEEEKALNTAKDLIKNLDEGANFEELAKKYSADTSSKENGGLYANFTKIGTNAPVSEFFDASLNLEDGKYTAEPVKTKYGYHIILKVSQKEKPSLEKTKDTIIEELYEEKVTNDTDLSVKVWNEIRKQYNLEIFDTDIKNIYDSTMSQMK